MAGRPATGYLRCLQGRELSETAINKTQQLLLGEITGAHGIRGELVVRSFTADPAGIAAYGVLTAEPGDRPVKLKVVRVTPKGVVVRIEDVNDRTAAEKLKGLKLYVARDRLPEAEPDTYYYADLVGLNAVDPSGAEVGTIIAVHNFGAGDILEIRLKGSNATELVAFSNDSVPEVDIAAKRAVVILPEKNSSSEKAQEED